MGNLLDKKIGRYIRHSIPGFVTYERVSWLELPGRV